MKYFLRAWEQLKRGFAVLALSESSSRVSGQLERGLEVLALGEMGFEGMGAVGKGV